MLLEKTEKLMYTVEQFLKSSRIEEGVQVSIQGGGTPEEGRGTLFCDGMT